ncbi:MAG: AAA family ATPase [Phycisphaerales bacterium]|nr:MAG: AAA family ATPase [Phycisphaerales bacterium]
MNEPVRPVLNASPPSTQGASRTESDDRFAHDLAQRIGAHKYNMWFGNARFLIERDSVEVRTENPFIAHWIRTNFADSIRDSAKSAFGRACQVSVSVPERVSAPAGRVEEGDSTSAKRSDRAGVGDGRTHDHRASSPDASRAAGARGRHRSARRAETFRRLEDFIVGETNRLAYAAVCSVADLETASFPTPVFIYGPCGVGKTHLLQGVVRRISESGSGSGRTNVRYVTAEQFTNEYIAAVRQNALESFRRAIRRLDLLAIDDVHFLSNKTRTQNEFLHTLDAISMTGARVIIASDSPPSQIRQISTALLSRLQAGMVARIDLPDRDTRRTLVNRLASKHGLRLTPSATELLIARCVGSVRQIEGTMIKLAAVRSLMSAESIGGGEYTDHELISQVLVERVLDESHSPRAVPVRMPEILDAVCETLNVCRADLFGNGRHPVVVLARSLAAYLGREMTTLSFPEIAAALGRRNHSTIHTADQRIRRQLETGATVRLNGQAESSLHELVGRLRHGLEQNRNQ